MRSASIHLNAWPWRRLIAPPYRSAKHREFLDLLFISSPEGVPSDADQFPHRSVCKLFSATDPQGPESVLPDVRQA